MKVLQRVGRAKALAMVSAAGLASTLAATAIAGLRFNLTGSIPIGFYREAPTTSLPSHGDIVLVCLADNAAGLAHSRGYVPRGGSCPGGLVPLGKVVMALPGDTVCVSSSGLAVNGTAVRNSRPLLRDGAGRDLPQLRSGRYVVGPQLVWLIGLSERSFDSRYLGAMSLNSLRGQLRPF
jgi:conjugative transfer signal peptidase TraF